jgi:hypothetical protein
MAKISTYAKDTLVQETDKWIGTDGPTGITKNFSPDALLDYYVDNGKIGVGAIEVGDTASRPTAPPELFEGLTRYNTDTKKIEIYNSFGWYNMGPEYRAGADSIILTSDSTTYKISERTH